MVKTMKISELLIGYKNKEFSPTEITKLFLERIEHVNKKLNAFITVSDEHALKQAKLAEENWMKGYQSSVLQGVPISYKDLINTQGIRTTNGSHIDKAYFPQEDAYVVQKLETAGAINLGKNNLHEYAFGITSSNPFYGSVKNPWKTDHIPGGSSGGSGVAVAANLGLASIGTDTGGSIRIPASACGVVGLKPTVNNISTKGIKGISWSLDHVGPLTQDVTDLAIIMEGLTDRRYSEHCKSDIRGMRIGVPTNFFTDHVEPEITKAYQNSLLELEKLGAILIDIELPFAEAASNSVFTIALAEGASIHETTLHTQQDDYGNDVKAHLLNGTAIGATDYIKALNIQKEAVNQLDHVLMDIDLIATPTLPVSPKPIGIEHVETDGLEEDIFTCMTRFTRLFSLTGHPALSIPVGTTTDNLPIGLQLVSEYHQEPLLIRAGFAFEEACLSDFYKQRSFIAENI
ncbi:amidase [Virgibacillus salarius]|nr:amidase [Virgibacillus salarius]